MGTKYQLMQKRFPEIYKRLQAKYFSMRVQYFW